MKRYLLFSSCILCLLLNACSQSIKESQVPAAVRAVVEKQYPSQRGKWEKEDGNYELSFQKEGKSISLLISEAGQLLETETEISRNELPTAAIAYANTNYAGKSIKEIAKIIDKDGIVTYEVAVKGKDLMFDSQGNFLKEIKD